MCVSFFFNCSAVEAHSVCFLSRDSLYVKNWKKDVPLDLLDPEKLKAYEWLSDHIYINESVWAREKISAIQQMFEQVCAGVRMNRWVCKVKHMYCTYC